MKNVVINEELVEIELQKLQDRRAGKRYIQDLIKDIGYYEYLSKQGYSYHPLPLGLYEWLKQEHKMHEFYFTILKHKNEKYS